jgi:hypothetical protein
MGEASAVPNDLYDYAAGTGAGNEELQSFVRRVLTPAVEEYRAGAIDYGYAIPDLTATPDGRIDGELLRRLTGIADRDRWVRDVSTAFRQADTGSVAPGQVPEPNRLADSANAGDAPVTVTDLALDLSLADVEHDEEKLRQLKDSMAQGEALAGRVNRHGLDDDAVTALANHKGDAYFLAAFFNGLDEDRLRGLIRTSGGDSLTPHVDAAVLAHYAATAYSSDVLSADAVNRIVAASRVDDGDDRGRYFGTVFQNTFLADLRGMANAPDTFINKLDGPNARYFASRSEVEAEFAKVLGAAHDDTIAQYARQLQPLLGGDWPRTVALPQPVRPGVASLVVSRFITDYDPNQPLNGLGLSASEHRMLLLAATQDDAGTSVVTHGALDYLRTQYPDGWQNPRDLIEWDHRIHGYLAKIADNRAENYREGAQLGTIVIGTGATIAEAVTGVPAAVGVVSSAAQSVFGPDPTDKIKQMQQTEGDLAKAAVLHRLADDHRLVNEEGYPVTDVNAVLRDPKHYKVLAQPEAGLGGETRFADEVLNQIANPLTAQ